MINSLRAEFRKLTTVRSTYFILGIACLIAAFFGFYFFGYKTGNFDAGNIYRVQDSIFFILNNVMFLIGIIGILLFTHEYRYNMINYTLTSAKDRLRVLLAKTAVLTGLSLVFGLLIVFITIGFTSWGLSLSNVDIVDQTVNFGQIIWRALFASFAVAMFGLIIGGIVRNQVGAIVGFLIAPGAVEGLLTLLLKNNASYLPFSALNQVMFAQTGQTSFIEQPLSPGKSALVVCVYLVIFWLITLWLLRRRDAN